MDEQQSILFEPLESNLNIILKFQNEFKSAYKFYEKQTKTMDNFSYFMDKLIEEYKKLYAEHIDFSKILKNLQQNINLYESKQQTICSINNKQSSEILGASRNCNVEKLSKFPTNERLDSKINYENDLVEKENIEQYVPIFSCDFDSDIENNFDKIESPSSPNVNTPVKVQNSPILSKRKKILKKSYSSVSNNSSRSITSSNESKSGTPCKISLFEKINEIEQDLNKESEIELIQEPLKSIENTSLSTTTNNQHNEKKYQILGVSKIMYGKTDYSEKGKKLRQTTLTLKKVTPVIDLSKINCNNNFNETNTNTFKKESSKNETCFDGKILIKNANEQKSNLVKNLNELNFHNKSSEVQSNKNEITSIDQNISLKDDEFIETSPAQNEHSKLRNKLSLNKKPEDKKIRTTSSNMKTDLLVNTKNEGAKSSKNCDPKFKNIQYKKSFNKISNEKIKTNSEYKNPFKVSHENSKSFKSQKSLVNDETYFSPAESSKNIVNINEIDLTEFEDKMTCQTPPVKKMLLNSFDVIPGREEESPDFVYKEAPVRKKNERAQLPGWSCRDCERWYSNLSEEEKKMKKNQCSKHRGKFKADVLTPESFWNPCFDDTNDSTMSD